MSLKYLLLAAVMACLSVWFGLNLQPFTLNTFKLPQQFLTTKTAPTTTTPMPIDFYKLSLQWPPSTCTSSLMTCKPPIARVFTIHGIWPQDVNDDPVSPYDPANPCTSQKPTPEKDLPTKLQPIQQNLTSQWPNLKDPQNLAVNFDFWKKEWKKHGQCSDYPTQPLLYFKSALQLKHGLDPVMGLAPGSSDTVHNFAAKVQSHVGAYPEIACIKNSATQALQLWEIHLCYKKPTPPQLPQTIENCPNMFRKGCISGSTRIIFPN